MIKEANSKTLAAVFLIAALAISFRVFNLGILGPFIDESIYIERAAMANFTSEVTVGFKVLGYALFYPTAHFADNALTATRMFIALLGAGTAIGIFFATRSLAGTASGMVAGIIWALMPFVVFHDRLAIHDPIICFFLAWALFFFSISGSAKTPVPAVAGGVALGLAVITKVTAMVGLFFIFFILMAQRAQPRRVLRLALIAIPSAMVPLLIVLPKALANADVYMDFLHMFIGGGDDSGSAEPLTLKRFWEERLILNSSLLYSRLSIFNGGAFIGLMALTGIWSVAKPTRIKTCLWLAFAVSASAYIVIFKGWYSRYYLPGLLPLAMLMGVALAEWLAAIRANWVNANRLKTVTASSLIAILLAGTGYQWISSGLDFSRSPHPLNVPDDDKFQYHHGWPSGVGSMETLERLKQLAAVPEKISVTVIDGGYATRIFPLMTRDINNIVWSVEPVTCQRDAAAALERIATASGKRFLLANNDSIKTFNASVTLVPMPKLIFEQKRGYKIFDISQVESFRFGDSTSVVTSVESPNGVEYVNGVENFWIGGEATKFSAIASGAEIIPITLELFPAPGVSGRAATKLSVSGEAVLAPRQGPATFYYKTGGAYTLEPLDKPNTRNPNIADTRPMILGARVLRGVADARPWAPEPDAGLEKVLREVSGKPHAIYYRQWPPTHDLLTHHKNLRPMAITLKPEDAAVEILKSARDGSLLLSWNKFDGYGDAIASLISPAPRLLFKSASGARLYSFDTQAWLKNEKSGVVVTSINNENGVEEWNGATAFWLNSTGAEMEILAKRAGVVELSAEILIGASAPNRASAGLKISSGGAETQITLAPGKNSIARLKVAAGKNVITLRPVDAPVAPAPGMDDKRVMLMGVKGPSFRYIK
ncbi:MAG: glycosyltransferase family 39 protein [Nitrospinae bacterium]|nr:glycosyltransferase family 39 protein [Nitrospinota bacterium]